MQLQFYRTKNFKSKAWKNKVMSTVEHCQSLLKEKEGRRRIAEVKKTCQLDLFQAGSTVFLDQKITHFSKIQIKVNFKQKQTLNFWAKSMRKCSNFPQKTD